MKKLFTLLLIISAISSGKLLAGGCSETQFNTAGEIVYFQFNNGNGTDSGQYALNATMNGASAAADMCSNNAKCVSFSGSSSGASVPNSGYMVVSNQVSISAWIYSTNIGNSQRIIDKSPVGSSSNFMLDIYMSKLRFFVAGTNVITTTVLSSNTWYHVAAVYNGATAKVYLNGAEIASVTGVVNCTANSMDLLIGKDQNNGSNFIGRIDGLRLYGRAFSAQEVSQLYHMPTLVANPEDVEICPGSPSVQLSASFCAPQVVTMVYKWYKDGNLISNNSTYSGATTSTLTILNPTQSEEGNYKVSASSSANCITVYSAEATVSQGTPVSVSNNGLVFYYNFSNAGMNDLSGNGNTLTAGGSYTATAGFDGVNNEAMQIGNVYGPHAAGVPMMDITNQLTFSMWFNMSSSATSQRLIDKAYAGNGSNYLLDLQNSRLRFICAGVVLQSTTTLSLNTWYHVTATYDGANMKIYLNGILDASVANTGSCVSNNLPLIIARDQTGTLGSNAFQGKLDEVRMYSRALSADEASLLSILPSITQQPQESQTLCTGDALNISVASPTQNATYQWKKNGVNLSGETSSTLSIASLSTGDFGNYQCLLTLGCISWLSDTAAVILDVPVITTSIIGPTVVCQNNIENYSIAPVDGADSYIWIGGTQAIANTLQINFTNGQSGTIYVAASNQCGTSEFVSLDITVNPAPAVPTITQNGAVLEATPGGAEYIWYYQGNPINGANTASYTPTANGNYMVSFIDANGCGSLSASYFYSSVGMNEIVANDFSVFPNPTKGVLNIETAEAGNFVLTNIVGEVLYSQQIQNKAVISLEHFAAGIYFLSEVNSGKTVKVVKE